MAFEQPCEEQVQWCRGLTLTLLSRLLDDDTPELAMQGEWPPRLDPRITARLIKDILMLIDNDDLEYFTSPRYVDTMRGTERRGAPAGSAFCLQYRRNLRPQWVHPHQFISEMMTDDVFCGCQEIATTLVYLVHKAWTIGGTGREDAILRSAQVGWASSLYDVNLVTYSGPGCGVGRPYYVGAVLTEHMHMKFMGRTDKFSRANLPRLCGERQLEWPMLLGQDQDRNEPYIQITKVEGRDDLGHVVPLSYDGNESMHITVEVVNASEAIELPRNLIGRDIDVTITQQDPDSRVATRPALWGWRRLPDDDNHDVATYVIYARPHLERCGWWVELGQARVWVRFTTPDPSSIERVRASPQWYDDMVYTFEDTSVAVGPVQQDDERFSISVY